MGDDTPAALRLHVTWGPNQDENARLRSVLRTLGIEEVSRDGAGALFAKEDRPRAPGAAGRRVTVRG